MFAPPPALLNFAPPTFDDEQPRQDVVLNDDDDDDEYDPYAQLGRSSRIGSIAPPAFTSSSDQLEDTRNGDGHLSGTSQGHVTEAEAQSATPVMQSAAIQARPSASLTDKEKAAKMADAKAKIEAFKKKIAAQQAGDKPKPPSPRQDQESPPLTSGSQHISAPLPPPPAQSGGIISRAPVRYDAAAIGSESESVAISAEQSGEISRTKKPGQKGFAQRILEKQGWQKGQGLGAQGQGITTAIVAQAQKRKKRSDAEGGGWVAPANMGRLVGGKKAKVDGARTDEPQPSVVVKYTGLLAGLDATEEIAENDLYQRIGETMNEKFGTVERIYVWLAGANEVFIKFTDGMGALRATTNEFAFKGNTVIGHYYPEDRFEDADYSWGTEANMSPPK
nr:dna-damage-repair/toleration protein, chloroplastic [Quercus suber]